MWKDHFAISDSYLDSIQLFETLTKQTTFSNLKQPKTKNFENLNKNSFV